MANVLNLDAVAKAETRPLPYPFFVVGQSVTDAHIDEVLQDFPAIAMGGSIALGDVKPGPRFRELIDELNQPAFREIISEKLDIDLRDRPMVITLRGISRAKDGRIHTDSKSKMATILIYFNQPWEAETGRLRILNSEDMDDFAAEVPPNPGTMIAFRVTEDCWHGYPAYEGVRQSIQINFVEDDKAAGKHGRRHGWTAKLKRLFS